MEIIEVTRIEFNSREAQDEFNAQMRFAHIPKSCMSYQDVFSEALNIQSKFKASFRVLDGEAVYDGCFFIKYQNTATTFIKY